MKKILNFEAKFLTTFQNNALVRMTYSLVDIYSEKVDEVIKTVLSKNGPVSDYKIGQKITSDIVVTKNMHGEPVGVRFK